MYVRAFFNVQCLICGNKTTAKKVEQLRISGKVIQKHYNINLKANYTLAMAIVFLQHNGNKL